MRYAVIIFSLTLIVGISLTVITIRTYNKEVNNKVDLILDVTIIEPTHSIITYKPQALLKKPITINVHDEHYYNFKKILINDIYKHDGMIIYPETSLLNYTSDYYSRVEAVVPVSYIDRIDLLMKDQSSHINLYYLEWIDTIYMSQNSNIIDSTPTEITFLFNSKVFHNLEDVNDFEILFLITIILIFISIVGWMVLLCIKIEEWEHKKNEKA